MPGSANGGNGRVMAGKDLQSSRLNAGEREVKSFSATIIFCQHVARRNCVSEVWDGNLVIDVPLRPKYAKVNFPKFTGGYSLALLPEL